MKVYGEEHDVQSHMFRLTITDMQDKFCGDCYNIHHKLWWRPKAATSVYWLRINFHICFSVLVSSIKSSSDASDGLPGADRGGVFEAKSTISFKKH